MKKDKNKKVKIINFVKENKLSILFLMIIFILLTYCSLQCFPINDDLPYSLFYRGTERITTIKEIILNQMSDYLTINGRFFVHCVVQFMLIFNRNLFSFVNALCIIVTIVFMKKIVDFYSNNIKQEKKIYTYFLITGLFLLIGNLKYMIYWVAGSINYVWIFTFLIIFIYYYLKTGLIKHKFLNIFLILIFSAIHECSFVFILFLIISDFIKNIIENKKAKDIIVYIIYFFVCILGGLFVIKSPGNIARMSTSSGWYDLSLIERFNLSIPTVSIKIFNLFYLENLVPTVFLIILCVFLFKKGNKLIKILNFFIVLVSLISFLTSNGWMYFILSILVFITIIIYNYKINNNNISVLWVSFYAVVFSMIITPEYNGGRPNYYLYIFMIINICIFIKQIFNKKIFINLINILSVLLIVFTGYYEYKIYSNIGNVYKDRIYQINKVKEENLNVLKYKKIDEKYAKYHADANCPDGKDYWAYRYFVYYYDLPEGIDIKLVD